MSTSDATPQPVTVDLKNRWLAAGLALLMPGLGHLYQGRVFKAAIYSVCILGLFFSGQALGDWQVVYLGDNDSGGRMSVGGRAQLVGRLLQGYGAQFPAGVFAWPAIYQNRRYRDASNHDGPTLGAPLASAFEGRLVTKTVNGPRPVVEVTGHVTLEPADGAVRGKFVGRTADGKPIEIDLRGLRDLGRPISANVRRTLEVGVERVPAGLGGPPDAEWELVGWIPRPFSNRYQVPLGDQGEDRLYAELGGRVEIAYVFTWIAGLLNVLAIWDALDGPAYGIGNEPEAGRKRRKGRAKVEPEPEPARRPEPAGRPA